MIDARTAAEPAGAVRVPAASGDRSAAINAALAAAPAGGRVCLDAAEYTIAAGLTIPAGVTLEGTFRGLPNLGPATGRDLSAWGTVLSVTYGAGTTTGQAITLAGDSAGVRGLAMRWPAQGVGGVSTVASYPWAIATDYGAASPNAYQSWGGVLIERVCLFNAYNGIALRGAYRFRVADVLMDVCRTGVYVDACYDTSWIERCAVTILSGSSGWADVSAQTAYKLANVLAYRLARCDSLTLSRNLVYGALAGLTLEAGALTAASYNGGYATPWATVDQMVLDICQVGLDAQSSRSDFAGVAIHNSTYSATGTDCRCVRLGSGLGKLRLNGGDFIATGTGAAHIQRDGGSCRIDGFAGTPTQSGSGGVVTYDGGAI